MATAREAGTGEGGRHELKFLRRKAASSAPAPVVEVERVAERVVPELPRGRHAPPPPGPAAVLWPLPAATLRRRRAEAAAHGGPHRRRRVWRSGLHSVHGVCLDATVLQPVEARDGCGLSELWGVRQCALLLEGTLYGISQKLK